jgi:L-alanine-DL-glutamate epimerase-like enolase superfamily enzyme
VIEITETYFNFEREPLAKPFGFKGGQLTELWQSVALLESSNGRQGLGLGTQSVLWSDPAVFAAHSEEDGNQLMAAVSRFAVHAVKGRKFSDPLDLQEKLLPLVSNYAREFTGRSDLRMTFVLNALVPIDFAAWQLYAAERSITSFAELIPPAYRLAFVHRHRRVAAIPTLGFNTSVETLAGEAFPVLKIKLGGPGEQEEMLEHDVRRMLEIHRVVDERAGYYLDLNGRYERKETVERFLSEIDQAGALERVLILEEPFPEEVEVDVSDLGVRVAADESAHTDMDSHRLIDLGYRAMALKPVAKTLSMTLKIARIAHERKVACFCADLTVNPILVDWNKSVAARVSPLPGIHGGLLEMNGHQNYRDWERMSGYHPHAGAPWMQPSGGYFDLSDDFYEKEGGIFEASPHYEKLARSSPPTEAA